MWRGWPRPSCRPPTTSRKCPLDRRTSLECDALATETLRRTAGNHRTTITCDQASRETLDICDSRRPAGACDPVGNPTRSADSTQACTTTCTRRSAVAITRNSADCRTAPEDFPRHRRRRRPPPPQNQRRPHKLFITNHLRNNSQGREIGRPCIGYMFVHPYFRRPRDPKVVRSRHVRRGLCGRRA